MTLINAFINILIGGYEQHNFLCMYSVDRFKLCSEFYQTSFSLFCNIYIPNGSVLLGIFMSFAVIRHHYHHLEGVSLLARPVPIGSAVIQSL